MVTINLPTIVVDRGLEYHCVCTHVLVAPFILTLLINDSRFIMPVEMWNLLGSQCTSKYVIFQCLFISHEYHLDSISIPALVLAV